MCVYVAFGGDKRTRTVHLLNAIQALYQMSYIPIFNIICTLPARPSLCAAAKLFPCAEFSAQGCFFTRLLRFDRADRATFFAGAAVDAHVRIDLILGISLRNRIDRAGIRARTAGNAIFRNLVSHCTLPPNYELMTTIAVLYIIPYLFRLVKAQTHRFIVFFRFFTFFFEFRALAAIGRRSVRRPASPV